MTKRQLIDEITMRNPTAKTDFLARFEEADLSAYLEHLIVARRPRLSSGGNTYAKYFVTADRMAAVGSGPAVRSGPVRGFLDDRLPVATPALAPASPVQEPDQVEDLPLEPSEPDNTLQPALFAPPAANTVANIVDEPAHDEPLPVEKSAWRETKLPVEVAASESVADVPSACDEGVSPSCDEDILSASLSVSSSSPSSPSSSSSSDQQQQDADETSAPQPDASAGSYQGQVSPIVLFRGARRPEPMSDDLEEMDDLPTLHTPYGQDLGDQDDTPSDEDAPPADVDEVEQEELAVDGPIDEDLPAEQLVEEPSEESAAGEESVEIEVAAKPARKKRQPVAVGAERESNNNQDSDSWLF
jgi:hypothetical protein